MDVKKRLQNVFREVFDDEEIEIFDEMTADDIEEWDSLIHINLIVAVEEEFGIRFNTAEVVSSKNVGEFISLIDKKL